MNERAYKPETIDRARMLREQFNPPWHLITENDYRIKRGNGLVDVPLRVTREEWLHTLWNGGNPAYVRTLHFVTVAFHEGCGCARGNGYCAFVDVMVRSESRVHSFSNHRNDGEAVASRVAAFLIERGSLVLLDD